MPRFPVRAIVTVCVLSIGAVLTATGAADKVLGAAGLNRLAAANDSYLQDSFDRSLRTFGVLSAIKVGLAVVKGTEVGVGVDIDIGGIVQATYDFIDIAWTTVLAGGVVLLGFRHALDALALVDHWLLLAMLVALLASALVGLTPRLRLLRTPVRAAALALTVLTAAAYLVVPLSIQGAAQLSTRITAPSMESVDQNLQAFEGQLQQSQQEKQGLFAALTKAQERLTAIGQLVSSKAADLGRWVLRIIAGYLFDCLVFPLGMLWLLLYFTKVIAIYFYGVERGRAFKDDLRHLLDSYFARRSSDAAADQSGNASPKEP